jgi:hypothetical protein
MFFYARLIAFSLPITILVVACAHSMNDDFVEEGHECQIGERCTVIGDLFIYRGSMASIAEIRTSQGCFAASLDEGIYQSYRDWNGRKVRASGLSYRQNYSEGVISYEINGRNIATGICPSGVLLLVDSIRELRR